MSELDEVLITKLILDAFKEDFFKSLDLDVAIVGAGPSGVTAAYYLAKSGVNVAIFERNLYVGGGMWGGGILFPRIVVQEVAKQVAEEMGVPLRKAAEGYYVADSVESVARCTITALSAGAKIWIGFSVEDVMIKPYNNGYRVCGLVINWSAVELAGLHVDPVTVRSRVVIDATGHEASIARKLVDKLPGAVLPTDTGGVVGELPMWAEAGERAVVENTKEVFPGLIVAGMAANAVFGSPRMGPIFGGMFLSGKKAAEEAMRLLEKYK